MDVHAAAILRDPILNAVKAPISAGLLHDPSVGPDAYLAAQVAATMPGQILPLLKSWSAGRGWRDSKPFLSREGEFHANESRSFIHHCRNAAADYTGTAQSGSYDSFVDPLPDCEIPDGPSRMPTRSAITPPGHMSVIEGMTPTL